MQELWARFERWLQLNAPQSLNNLNPGASETELVELAELIGAELPADFQAFYRIHNGQDVNGSGLFAGEELLSVARMRDEWTVWNGLLKEGIFEEGAPTSDPGVRNNWWNPKWLPLTYNGAGDHCCLDLDPAPDGTIGQVIRMWHDMDMRPLLAHSFTEWITSYVTALEAGEYFFSEEYNEIILVDDV